MSTKIDFRVDNIVGPEEFLFSCCAEFVVGKSEFGAWVIKVPCL